MQALVAAVVVRAEPAADLRGGVDADDVEAVRRALLDGREAAGPEADDEDAGHGWDAARAA